MAGLTPFGPNNQVINGAMTADNVIMKGTGMESGAIVQRVQFQIERPINFIYEIGSTAGKANVYYVGNRRRGQATFERVVGGSNSFTKFMTGYGDLCKPSDPIELTAKGGCQPAANAGGGQNGVKYTLQDPKITGVGVNVSAEQVVILENVQMAFVDLGYEAV
jgi:hypothetical protein